MPSKLCSQRADELIFFARGLDQTPAEILNFVKFYNHDFSKYDNSVYAHPGSRVVHWWNYEDHDWFAARIDKCLNYIDALLEQGKRVLLVDVGFSVPYILTRPSLAGSDLLWCLLIDKEKSAGDFYRVITTYRLGHQRLADVVSISD